MRSTLLTLALLALSPSAYAGHADGRGGDGAQRDHHAYVRHDHGRHERQSPEEELIELERRSANLHAELDTQLARVEHLLEDRWDHRTDREIRRTVSRARDLRRAIAALDVRRAEIARFAIAPPVPTGPCALSPQAFAAVVGAIRNEHFDDGRLAVLRSAAASSFFTVDQVRQVMAEFTFGDGKIGAADLLYDRTLDRERWFLLYAELTFSSEKEELRRRTG